MLSLTVMLFWLSVERVKGLHGKRGMCILRLQKYLRSSVCTHQSFGTNERRFLKDLLPECMTGQVLLLILTVSLYMFARKQKSYNEIPPTNAALDYHIKCAA